MANYKSAFPVIDSYVEPGGVWRMDCIDSGMSLRDYFAGQALNGLIINSQNITTGGKKLVLVNEYAELAYKTADAMLIEREKKE